MTTAQPLSAEELARYALEAKDAVYMREFSGHYIKRLLATITALEKERDEARTDAACAAQDYDNFKARAQSAEAEVGRLREAANAVLGHKFWLFKSENGREISVEDLDGEKCWIVKAEDVTRLEAALAQVKE